MREKKMNEIYVIGQDNSLVKINAHVYEKYIDMEFRGGTIRIPCDFDVSDFLYGDVLMARLDKGPSLIPIRITQHYADRSSILKESIKSELDNMEEQLKSIKASMKKLNHVTKSKALMQLADHVINECAKYEQDATNRVFLAQKYHKPIVAPVKVGGKNVNAFIDGGADIALIDESLKSELKYTELGDDVHIGGITNNTISKKQHSITVECSGLRADVEFAFYEGLRSLIGYKVLIARDFVNYAKEKGVIL
ncbi:MAG: hypothetical protein GF364_12625 [Candidatus Lokiarchaeota archaeon]|nr:hypothetical protein [Candidatus Lokiarchaeota archaeon]